MRLFDERNLFRAYRYAEQGGQALHLFENPGIYPGAPQVFKKSKKAGHLFDRDMIRLIATARMLGLKVIKVHRKGTKKQHIDLCGRPLLRAIVRCKK